MSLSFPVSIYLSGYLNSSGGVISVSENAHTHVVRLCDCGCCCRHRCCCCSWTLSREAKWCYMDVRVRLRQVGYRWVERSQCAHRLTMKRLKAPTALRISPMITVALVSLLSRGVYLKQAIIVTVLSRIPIHRCQWRNLFHIYASWFFPPSCR